MVQCIHSIASDSFTEHVDKHGYHKRDTLTYKSSLLKLLFLIFYNLRGTNAVKFLLVLSMIALFSVAAGPGDVQSYPPPTNPGYPPPTNSNYPPPTNPAFPPPAPVGYPLQSFTAPALHPNQPIQSTRVCVCCDTVLSCSWCTCFSCDWY